jgi:hypothetical protein
MDPTFDTIVRESLERVEQGVLDIEEAYERIMTAHNDSVRDARHDEYLFAREEP